MQLLIFKLWPTEKLETLQDIRNIKSQFSVLKSDVISDFSALIQKISSPSENLEKEVYCIKI